MTAPAPELTIVVPTHNRRERLRTLLDSLARQSAPVEAWDVVIVVDGSRDGTEEMLAQIELPFRITVVAQEQQGQAAAVNNGVRQVKARACLFLDDDMVADENLVREHLEVQRQDREVVGIGRLAKLLPEQPERWARWRARGRDRHYESLVRGRPPVFLDCFGGNLCVPAELFLATGGLNGEVYAHDVEFAYRLKQHGAEFVYIDSAYAEEDDRETANEFIADSRRRGADAVGLWRRHPELLAHLPLGGRSESDGKWGVLLRLALATRVPPIVLVRTGSLVPDAFWERGWSRLLFLLSYWQGVRDAVDPEDWARLRSGTVILTYHAIGQAGEAGSRYILPVSEFERQMGWLKARGYPVIGLDELARLMAAHELPPARSVVITFDDGYRDNVELALPVLERHGYPATIFLVTHAGDSNEWDEAGPLRGRPLMSLSRARELLDKLTFGAHTRTHPALAKLPLERAQLEIEGSKDDLEQALGAPVELFSYPFGNNSDEVRDLAAAAGFAGACTVERGPNRAGTDRFRLRRFDVRGTDSFVRFVATLVLRDQALPSTRRRR